MKRLIIFLIVVIFGYLGVSSYIDSNKKRYLDEILDSYNKAEGDTLKFSLKDFRDDSALIEIKDLASGESIDLNTTLESGPIISTRAIFTLLRLEAKKDFTEFFSKEDAKELQKALKKPVEFEYQGLLDFMHIMHEDMKLSKIDYQDSTTAFYLSPLLIKSDYVLKTLAGKTSITTNRLIVKDLKKSNKIDIKKPFVNIKFYEFAKDEPIYGDYSLGSDNISLYFKDHKPIQLGLNLEFNLNKNANKDVDFEIKSNIKSANEIAKNRAFGIEEFDIDLAIKNLGLAGVKELIKLKKEQNRVQAELQKALQKKDDIAMQKAIITMQKLENSWVDIYNRLLIKDKTKIVLDKEIKREKLSKVHIDLTFTGDKLSGDSMGALIALGARGDKLFRGDIDIEVEKELIEKLYPQVGFILDAMAKKNLAKLKDGIYLLKAKFEDGKIIINGTKYNPQELAMMILM